MNILIFKKQRIYVLIAICLLLASLNLIRNSAWSYDILEYQVEFERINRLEYFSLSNLIYLSMEPAFIVFSIATGYFSEDVNLLLFLLSLTSLLIKLVYIPGLYIKFPFAFLACYALTYFTLLELTQNRIAIASAFIILGYHFLIQDRKSIFISLVILASLFHYTAILALVAPIFLNKRNHRIVMWQIIVIVALFLLSLSLKSSFVFSLIELLDAKKSSYLAAGDEDLGSGFLRLIFVLSYQTLILFSCRPGLLKGGDGDAIVFHKLIFNLYVLSISIYITLQSYGVVAVRLAEVFRNLEPFLLFLTLSHCKKSSRIFVIVAVVFSICVNLQKNNHIIYPVNLVFKYMGLTTADF